MILTCAIDFIHTGEGLPLDAGLHAYASRMLQTTCLSFVIEILPPEDTLAERLRRRPAKPMGSPRVGSNPTGVVLAFNSTDPKLPCSTFDLRISKTLDLQSLAAFLTETLWPSG